MCARVPVCPCACVPVSLCDGVTARMRAPKRQRQPCVVLCTKRWQFIHFGSHGLITLASANRKHVARACCLPLPLIPKAPSPGRWFLRNRVRAHPRCRSLGSDLCPSKLRLDFRWRAPRYPVPRVLAVCCTVLRGHQGLSPGPWHLALRRPPSQPPTPIGLDELRNGRLADTSTLIATVPMG